MKKTIILLSVLSFLSVSLIAQKTTEKFATYDITLKALKSLSSKANYFVKTPFLKEAEAYVKKHQQGNNVRPGMTYQHSKSAHSTPPAKPQPIDLTKTFLDVINIDTKNYKPNVAITFYSTDYIIDSYNLYEPSKTSEEVAFTYSYKSNLEIVEKDGEVVDNPVFTEIKSKKVLVKEMSKDVNLVKSFNKLKQQYLTIKKQMEDKQKKKPKSDFDDKIKTFEDSYQKKFSAFFSSTLRGNYAEGQISKDLLAAKEFLKSNYDTQVKRVSMPVYGAKGKEDYTQINESQIKVQELIKRIKAGKKHFVSYSEVKKGLEEAIAVWNSESQKLEKDNKKARINNKIYAGLKLNTANAYVVINQYDNSKKALEDFYSVYPKKVMVGQGSYRYYARILEETLDVLSKFDSSRVSIFSEEQKK